jgi:pyrroloquinoline quinone biosynthesis protein D
MNDGTPLVPEITPTFRLQWEESQDRYVLLYPEGMVQLNPSAAEILKRCDGAKNIDEIIADLDRSFPNADVESDVLKFLEQARKNGWIRHRQPH